MTSQVQKSVKLKASIILLVYNQESTIRRAITSVLRQQCIYPYEIVVADDGSSDATREIALEYARLYPEIVRVLEEKPNRGLVGNYFDAVEECRGEYIGDCAGDDEWLDTQRLQRQIETLEKNPNLTAVYTDVETCEINGKGELIKNLYSKRPEYKRWMRQRVPGREIIEGVLSQNPCFPYLLSSALYRKEALLKVYEANRGIVRMPSMGIEDVPTIVALGSLGDAAYIPIIGYRYYISGESLSNNLNHSKEFSFYERILPGIQKLAIEYGVDTPELKGFYKRILNHITSQARHLGNIQYIAKIKELSKQIGIPLPIKGKINLLLLKLHIKL